MAQPFPVLTWSLTFECIQMLQVCPTYAVMPTVRLVFLTSKLYYYPFHCLTIVHKKRNDVTLIRRKIINPHHILQSITLVKYIYIYTSMRQCTITKYLQRRLSIFKEGKLISKKDSFSLTID